MRKVAIPDPPPSLTSPRTLAEREAALAWFADPTHLASPFEKPGFNAYRSDDVKDTLDRQFSHKCAYCESSYAAVMPLDVEHFRPKAKVSIRAADAEKAVLTPPGYYWLASDWHNLLPSCADCNRPRRQELPQNLRATAGKANQFPVRDERKRATAPGAEQKEPRLLLHPYFDDPRQHLRFVNEPDGFRDGEVEPAPRGKRRLPSPQGKASIEVYALQRRGLIDARKAMLVRVRLALVDVQDALEDINSQGLTPKLKARFERHVAELKAFAAADQEYSAMCAQVIDEAFAVIFGRTPP